MNDWIIMVFTLLSVLLFLYTVIRSRKLHVLLKDNAMFEERVEELIEIFRNCCSRRTQIVPTAPPFIGEGFLSAAPVEVTIGGATIFILDIDKFLKI